MLTDKQFRPRLFPGRQTAIVGVGLGGCFDEGAVDIGEDCVEGVV